MLLRGQALRVLVVGGGAVGTRRAQSVLEGGAHVRVIAPELTDVLRALAGRTERLELLVRPYASGDVREAALVIAAAGDRAVNARVGRDARAAGRMVVVCDAPEEGTCWLPAVHRAGELTIAVSAGGVPAAAARIRDALASRFNARYGAALDAIAATRASMLRAGERAAWRALAKHVMDEGFCERVEAGTLAERVRSWR